MEIEKLKNHNPQNPPQGEPTSLDLETVVRELEALYKSADEDEDKAIELGKKDTTITAASSRRFAYGKALALVNRLRSLPVSSSAPKVHDCAGIKFCAECNQEIVKEHQWHADTLKQAQEAGEKPRFKIVPIGKEGGGVSSGPDLAISKDVGDALASVRAAGLIDAEQILRDALLRSPTQTGGAG